MRWFILILISANVALFFWLQYEELPEEPVLALPPPDIGRLELLREPSLVEQQTSRDAGTAEADVVPADDQSSTIPSLEVPAKPVELPDSVDLASSGRADQTEDEQPIALAEPAPEPPPGPLPEAASAPGSETTSDSVVESPEVTPLAEVERSLPVSAEPVSESTEATPEPTQQEVPEVSVDEIPAETVAQNPEPDSREEAVGLDSVVVEQVEDEPLDQAVAPPPVVASCARVGPLSPEDADGLISALPVFIELLSDVSEEIVVPRGYYVMIPPLPSRAEGRQKMAELESAGITDTWLFPRGQYRNAISLGLFNRQSGALRRQQRVSAAGFDVEIIDRSTRREIRRILLKNVDGGDIALSLPLPEGASAESLPCP